MSNVLPLTYYAMSTVIFVSYRLRRSTGSCCGGGWQVMPMCAPPPRRLPPAPTCTPREVSSSPKAPLYACPSSPTPGTMGRASALPTSPETELGSARFQDLMTEGFRWFWALLALSDFNQTRVYINHAWPACGRSLLLNGGCAWIRLQACITQIIMWPELILGYAAMHAMCWGYVWCLTGCLLEELLFVLGAATRSFHLRKHLLTWVIAVSFPVLFSVASIASKRSMKLSMLQDGS